MIKIVKNIAFVGLFVGLSLAGLAQFPVGKPTPGDTLKSIRILADKKVTLSIYAPKASEVKVTVARNYKRTSWESGQLQLDRLLPIFIPMIFQLME